MGRVCYLRLNNYCVYDTFSSMLRTFSLLILLCFSGYSVASAQLGSGNACVYRSTVWTVGGDTFRTEISSRAQNGCKELSVTRNGVEQSGLDCNCDLRLDDAAGGHPVPPAHRSTALIEVCHGPIADPLLYDKPTSIEVID